MQKPLAFFLHILYNSLTAMQERCIIGVVLVFQNIQQFKNLLVSVLIFKGKQIRCKFVSYYGDDEDALAQDDGEFVILKTEEVNGEEMLVSIEEDAEYETIGNKFLERLNEIYGDEDDEEDEDDDEIFE